MSKQEIKQLIADRDRIDSQLAELRDVLKAFNADMETPLVDQEGFPVADLDIVQIRKARHSIICLTNDRKNLTSQIEEKLIELHASARKDTESSTQNEGEEKVRRTSNKPFLRVENVVYNSPAYHGGLLIDDMVIQCGPLHADNFKGLQNLSEVIGEHVGKSITLTVLRGTAVHHATVHPGKWEGAGVFGARFHVVHADQESN